MSIKEFFEKYPRIKQYLLPIIIGTLGFFMLIVGLVTSLAPRQEEKITFENTQLVEGASIQPMKSKEVTVDVSGAVVKAGIYSLAGDSRVQDALLAAGGLSQGANKIFVEQKINLAAKLIDGQKTYIPKEGEQTSHTTSDEMQQGTDGSGLININEATEKQLDTLPGIGPVTAQKIISGRPYGGIEELLSKKIVSNKVFNQIKDKIGVY